MLNERAAGAVAASAGSPAAPGATATNPTAATARSSGTVRRWVWRRLLRGFTLTYQWIMAVLAAIGRRPRSFQPGEGIDVLLTGTFYSDNWVLSHIRPIAMAAGVKQVYVASTFPVPDVEKVTWIRPPGWLCQLVGGVPARLLCFTWFALRRRPHFVGGFHLLLNGMVAAMVARMAGSRSLYFCVGGPQEVLDGGIHAENRLFGRLERPDAVVERRLIRFAGYFDLIVTMGTRAVTFLREHGIGGRMEVISGGIDGSRFTAATGPRDFDLVLVGRLAPIKRIDVMLEGVALARRVIPGIRVAIVGDGELRDELEQQAQRLGLSNAVEFAGLQRNVTEWVCRSKVFVLTSDSEGLALSLMEAMTCGLPAIVSNVGDLGDLVKDGQNGFLIPRRDPAALADKLTLLLGDDAMRERMGQAARRDALRHELSAVGRRWDDVFGSLAGHGGNADLH